MRAYPIEPDGLHTRTVFNQDGALGHYIITEFGLGPWLVVADEVHCLGWCHGFPGDLSWSWVITKSKNGAAGIRGFSCGSRLRQESTRSLKS